MVLPLSGVRVIDLTWYAAGPFCTRVLGDYGAEVLKVEPPTGDPARWIGPFFGDDPDPEKSGLFLFLNTNKKSLTLDLKTDAGKEVLLKLAGGADALVENFSPGVMSSFSLSYEVLSQSNPKLVMTSMSNFGQSGPYKDWQGTDLTLYAMGGNMSGVGPPDKEPLKTAGRLPSYHIGYVAALATAMGLWAARRRGVGDHIDVDYFQALMHSIDGRLGRLMSYQHNGSLPQRTGENQMGVGSGMYACADGFFLLTAGPTMLPGLARMIGEEGMLEDPKWNSVPARSRPEAAAEFDEVLVPWMRAHTKKEIRALCQQYGVLGGPMNTVADVVDDEHLRYRGYFQTIEHPATGPIEYPGYQFTLHGDQAMPSRRRAPLLGEHTTEVLTGLGYQSAEVERLREQKVV